MNDVHEIRDLASGKLLHLVIRPNLGVMSQVPHRTDLVESENFLQVASMHIPSGTMYRPHLHLERHREFLNLKAQESWVVLKGEVRANFFDEAGVFVESATLGPGSASFTLHGGHSYEGLSDAVVLEYKSGPYEGQELDKRFLD